MLQSTQLRPGESAFSHRLTGIAWTGIAPLLLQQETKAALLRLECKQACFHRSKENPTQCSPESWECSTWRAGRQSLRAHSGEHRAETQKFRTQLSVNPEGIGLDFPEWGKSQEAFVSRRAQDYSSIKIKLRLSWNSPALLTRGPRTTAVSPAKQ